MICLQNQMSGLLDQMFDLNFTDGLAVAYRILMPTVDGNHGV